ncbi:uncharacterized protein LOC108468331 [Gossypium arboreum]|uniref:uncharacterized protein LOC108468331 n=1 Tax=Gossypium arboreum TaxID=29729 RepID=UPI00081966C4|nr:uncharacterized protein LOC108468331 [Gossypium arboreum]
MKVEKMLGKGCEAYLTYVMNSFSKELRVQDISIVKDFNNVFPEALLGLSLDHELDFGIELYLDDILVYSHSKEDLELSECEYWLKKVRFLGHVVLTEEIRVVSKKIKAILVWKVPRSVTEVMSSLGLAEYHPGKANVVVDALSRKSITELRAMFARLSLVSDGGLLAELQVVCTALNRFKANDSYRGAYWFLCYVFGSDKMYHDLKEIYWWSGLKHGVMNLLTQCLVCQKVKAEYQFLSVLLQSIAIPE